MESLTLSRQTNKEAGTTSFVSQLHPTSAAILQNLCLEAFSKGTQSNSPVKENVSPPQEKGTTAVPEKKWEPIGNINQDIPARYNNYPTQYQNYANYANCQQQQFDNRFLAQQQHVDQAAYRDASFMKHPLFNHWIQSQWKAVNSGL